MNNVYVVMLIGNITNAHLNASANMRLDNSRKNSLNTKAVLKFNRSDDVARNVFIDQTWYTYQQIINDVLAQVEWR